MKRFMIHGLVLIFIFIFSLLLSSNLIHAFYGDVGWTSDPVDYGVHVLDSDGTSLFAGGIGSPAAVTTYFVCSYDLSDGTENYCLESVDPMLGMYYVGYDDDYVYTTYGTDETVQYRTKATGVLVDSFSVGTYRLIDFIIDDDILYAININDEVIAIDLSDLSTIWNIPFAAGGIFDYGGMYELRQIIGTNDDSIFIPLFDGTSYPVGIIQKDDGDLTYSISYPGRIGAIASNNDHIFVGGTDGYPERGVYAYDVSGSVATIFDNNTSYISENYNGTITSILIGARGLFVAGLSENVKLFDMTDGTLIKEFDEYGTSILSLYNSDVFLFVGGVESVGEIIAYDISPYEITFETNGGSLIPSQYVYSTDLIEEPTPPTKAGHTFAGWYENIGLTIPWNFSSGVAITDLTFYADWDIDVYTVVFNPNGGTPVSDYYGISYGSTITRPTSPTRTNYNFIGWYSDSELTQEWKFNQDEVTEDLILYAKWRQDIGPTITEWFGDIGFDSSWGKLFVSFVLIIGIIVLLAHLGATAPIITFVTIVLFVLLLTLGFIPLWIGIVVMVIQFAFLFITLKGGGGSGED